MYKLTYEELILLDNLIYLGWDAKEDESLLTIVDNILKEDELDRLINSMENCIMKLPKAEWQDILNNISNKQNLSELRVKKIYNCGSGMRIACFVDNENNLAVIFRGTSTTKEWEDNGKGAYEYDTPHQIEALDYINNLEYENITVSGHSKGGNQAQYVTILSPKITRCVSVNGQGFSNEFVNKYKEQIEKNKSKIICINSKYDYVSCLLNSIGAEYHYIRTSFQINPSYYHKCNILLDENGDLRQETSEAAFSKVINYFSISLISDLSQEMGNLIITSVISAVELILCRGELKNKILEAAQEFLIMACHEDCYENKKIFNISYTLLEILILPMLFWEDLIRSEEEKSNELLYKITKEINKLTDKLIKKLIIISSEEINLIDNISKTVLNFDLIFKNLVL